MSPSGPAVDHFLPGTLQRAHVHLLWLLFIPNSSICSAELPSVRSTQWQIMPAPCQLIWAEFFRNGGVLCFLDPPGAQPPHGVWWWDWKRAQQPPLSVPAASRARSRGVLGASPRPWRRKRNDSVRSYGPGILRTDQARSPPWDRSLDNWHLFITEILPGSFVSQEPSCVANMRERGRERPDLETSSHPALDRFARRYPGTVGGKQGRNSLVWKDKCSGFCKLNALCWDLIENFVMWRRKITRRRQAAFNLLLDDNSR